MNKYVSNVCGWLIGLATYGICIPQTLAIPARSGVVTVKQKDGTVLRVTLHGDEFSHYALSEDGYTLVRGDDGNYYYATLDPAGLLAPTEVKAQNKFPGNTTLSTRAGSTTAIEKGVRPQAMSERAKEMMESWATPKQATAAVKSTKAAVSTQYKVPDRIRNQSFPTTGKQKYVVLLAEFPDLPFTEGTRQNFTEMLNGHCYSYNGATGSAWQYYYDNSNGRFDPEYAVLGPYKLSNDRSYYTANEDAKAREMAAEVCTLAHDAGDVDFSQYAVDGTAKDVFIFYSGGGEADGADPDGIWPHRSTVSSGLTLDGVSLSGYACSAELMKTTDGTICLTGIGAFCHEFGHVLGWPDFYDTNYEQNGQNYGPSLYSLMDSGDYNNESHTPPALSILERWMVGWTEPEEITASGSYTLYPVTQDKGYLIGTPSTNDYFLLEYRGKGDQVWDKAEYLTRYSASYGSGATAYQGLLVYHIDYSNSNYWYNNTLNAISGMECMKVVCSYPVADMVVNYPANAFYPGGFNVTKLQKSSNKYYASWQGATPNYELHNIALADGTVTFTVGGICIEELSAYQNDVVFSWSDDMSDKWTIAWKTRRDRSYKNSQEVTEKTFHLSELTPNTIYEVTITGSADVEQTFSFITGVSSYSYQAEMELVSPLEQQPDYYLVYLNGVGTVKSITWTIDGEESSNFCKLSVGDHEVRAEVETQSGYKAYYTRYFNVQ